MRPPGFVLEAVQGFGEFGGVGVRGDVAADGHLEDLLALRLGVQVVRVEVAGVQAVLDVVHRVRHVVRPVHHLGLEARARAGGALADPVEDGPVVPIDAELAGRGVGGVRSARPGVLGGRVQGGPGEVEADARHLARRVASHEALRFDAGEESQGLRVALEAAAVVGEFVEGLFAVVAEGGMAQVVGEAGRLHEVRVAAQGRAQLPAHLGALQGVGQAGAGAGVPGLAAGAGGDHLGLAREAAQGGGVEYAGAVALEGGAAGAFVGLGCPAVD